MRFDWERWTERFIAYPGFNDTELSISEVAKPSHKVIGIHRLTSFEDNAQQLIYVDVLNKSNERQMYAEVEYNSGVSDPLSVLIDRTSREIVYFPFPSVDDVNMWCPGGEGVTGLKPGYSYLVVFREADRSEPEIYRGGILVTVNQGWVASLKSDQQGNVSFFVDIK